MRRTLMLMALPALCAGMTLAGLEQACIPEEVQAGYTAQLCAEEREEQFVTVQIGGHALRVRLADNASAAALLELLKDGPRTIPASNYGGFEKVCALGAELPSDDVQTRTRAGDVMLYSGDQIVLFYGENQWAYTRLGWIEDVDDLAAILSGADSELTLCVE